MYVYKYITYNVAAILSQM